MGCLVFIILAVLWFLLRSAWQGNQQPYSSSNKKRPQAISISTEFAYSPTNCAFLLEKNTLFFYKILLAFIQFQQLLTVLF